MFEKKRFKKLCSPMIVVLIFQLMFPYFVFARKVTDEAVTLRSKVTTTSIRKASSDIANSMARKRWRNIKTLAVMKLDILEPEFREWDV